MVVMALNSMHVVCDHVVNPSEKIGVQVVCTHAVHHAVGQSYEDIGDVFEGLAATGVMPSITHGYHTDEGGR